MTLNCSKNTFFSKQDIGIYSTDDDDNKEYSDYLTVSINAN